MKAIKQLIKKIICKFKGHDYPCAAVDSYTLCYCTRCKKEIMDRTFDDIEPLPDDYEPADYDIELGN